MECDGKMSGFLRPSGPAALSPNDTIPVDVETDGWHEQEVFCSAGTAPGSERDLVFTVRTGSKFLLLNSVRLETWQKILKENGEEAISGAAGSRRPSKVIYINDIGHSQYSQVSCYVNSCLCTDTDNSYGYRSYILATLQNTKNAKETYMLDRGYFYDDFTTPAGTDDAAELGTAEARASLKARQNWIKKVYNDQTNEALTTQTSSSKIVKLNIQPNESIFHVDEVIPPGCELTIHFRRAPDAFSLISGEDENEKFKIYMSRAALKIALVDYAPSAKVKYYNKLESDGVYFKFPYHYFVRTLPITANTTALEFNDCFVNKRPKRLIAFLVNNKTLRGNVKTDPFRLHHHGLKTIEIKCDETLLTPFEPDWIRDWSAMYRALHTVLERDSGDLSTGITSQIFRDGYVMSLFDTSSNRQVGPWPQKTNGVVRARISFNPPSPDPLSLILIAEFSAYCYMDGNRCMTYYSNV